MAKAALEAEYEYYLAHKDELLRQYEGRLVVIKGEEVLGVYDDDMEAIEATTKTHRLGTFMVHRVSAQEDVLMIHPWVVFS